MIDPPESTGRARTVLRHRSLPESVHEILRTRILNNELPAGTPLVELNLADEFGVSRTTVRAALRELQAERLIEVQPRRQTIVTRMSAEDVTEACYARYVLESASLAEFWEEKRPQLLAAMTEVVRTMELAAEKGDLASVVEADTELHLLIVHAGGHPRVIEMCSSLNGQMGALMRSSLERQGIDMVEAARRH
ncbi:MAG: GntR family transcriptional regulator, partial [Propionibacteriaceae bacterium]